MFTYDYEAVTPNFGVKLWEFDGVVDPTGTCSDKVISYRKIIAERSLQSHTSSQGSHRNRGSWCKNWTKVDMES